MSFLDLIFVALIISKNILGFPFSRILKCFSHDWVVVGLQEIIEMLFLLKHVKTNVKKIYKC